MPRPSRSVPIDLIWIVRCRPSSLSCRCRIRLDFGRKRAVAEKLGGGRNRQDRLSCAPCCAALSLRTIPINESAGFARPQEKATADDRYPAELSSPCGVYRGGKPDRVGTLDRPVPRRLPAARSRKAFCL